MSQSLRPYLDNIRSQLERSFCLQYFPSPIVERHSKPEVEVQTTPGALLEPIKIVRSSTESILIEPSINSVRISLQIKKSDELEQLLCHKFSRFMMQRADNFYILRRKPLPGYDLSFLITNDHVEQCNPSELVNFVISFLEEVDKEVSDMKIGVNSRARLVAETFLSEFV